MKNSLLVGILSLLSSFTFSQITTNTTPTPTDMVDRIMGTGVTFSNAVFTGDNVSRGYFDNGGTTNLGMNSGIVLTSGRADLIPVNNGGASGNNNTGASIAALNTIAGASTFDGAILEFDFVTISNQINVRYLFGSDEYLEFVNAGYNDAFAFFISGPGIVGEQNIALVGGLPVTIDNINTTTNSGFFVNNSTSGAGATTIEYDGFTVTLTAVANVQPCQTYHIRLMIADGGDGIYDSGVFIEENGFFASGTSTTVDVNPGVGFNNAVEGCDLFSTFVVNIPAPVGTPTTFNYTFTGTATYGVDYEGVPLSVTIPAGQTSAPIVFEIYDDGLTEPVESIILNIETSPCIVEEFTLTITDPTPIDVTITDGTSCQATPFDLTATASGGSGALTYSWDNGGGSGQTVSVTPNATTTYTLTVTDQCGDTGTGQSTLTIFDLPVVDAGSFGPVCVDAADVALAGSPLGGTYTGTGVTGSNFDPNAGTQTLTYTFTDGNNCTNTDQTTITVNNLPVVDAGSYGPVCIDAADITLAGTPVGGAFSGTGVTGSNFDPSAGTQTLTYTFIDGNNCTNSATTSITVNNLPVVDAGTYGPVCIDAADIALAGTPGGGTFSGTGVTGSTFDPSVGTQTVTYSFTDGNNCTNTATTSITVNNLPVVDAGTYAATCIDGVDITLAGTPVGGSFTGTGVSGTTFDPSVGTQTITYTFTDGNGCTNSDQVSITVNSLLAVDAGSYGPVCIDAADIALAGTPVGGTFSGTGVSGTTFDPSAGTQTITYTFTDGNNCTNSGTTTITVNNLPVVDAGTYGPVCIDAADIALAGTPLGGTFTGTGVTGSNFDPSAGTQTLTYSFTDGNSCTSSATTSITVNNLPVVDAGSYGPVCIDAADIALAGTPVGGTFTGTGVTGSNFDPSAGTQTLTYSFTDGNSCTSSATTSITVNNLPVVNAGSYGPVCIDAADIALAGTPIGGTFSGTGVTGSNFDPSVGTQTLTYTVTDGNNCTNSATTSITVNNLPVVNAGSYGPVCIDVADIALAGTPVGGTFSGTGVTGSNFDPSVGTQTLTYTVTDGNNCTNSATTSITVNNLPVVDAGTYAATCIDGADVTLAGTPVGGTFTGTGVTGLSFDPSVGTQTITYTFTDGNNCTNSDQATITVNNLLAVDAGSYLPVCVDAADVALVGSPAGGTFTGTGVTGSNFDPSAGTQTITYTFTDVNNCTNSGTTTITVNALPTIGAGNDVTVCAGQTVTLNGTGGVSYAWNNSGTNGVAFTPTATTTYTVTGTDGNGCQNTDNMLVTVNALPTVNAGTDATVCTGSQVTLTGTGTATTYTWNNGISNGVAFTPATTTTYTVTGVDVNNCQNTDQVVITVVSTPTVNAGLDQTVCAGQSVTLTGTGTATTYTWNNGVTNGVAFTPTSTTTYTVTGLLGTCQATDQVTVTVNPVPTVTAGADQTICVGESVTLTGGGANTYTWTGGVTNGTAFSPTQTTTYTVTGVATNGCSDTDDVTVTVNSLPTVNAGTDLPVCSGTAITLTATGSAATYTWSGGITNGTAFTPASSGTYTVTAVDANGCSNTDQVVVTVTQTPIANFTADEVLGNPGLTVNFTNTSTNATSFEWDFGNGDQATVSSTAGQSSTYDDLGVYTVELTAINGQCTDTQVLTVTIEQLPDVVIFIPNVTTITGDGVNDGWWIGAQNAKSINVQIFNRWGNQMAEITEFYAPTNPDSYWDGTVNGTPASDGTYFYKYVIVDLFDVEHTGHGHFTVIK